MTARKENNNTRKKNQIKPPKKPSICVYKYFV